MIVSSASTTPLSGSRSGLTMPRRSLAHNMAQTPSPEAYQTPAVGTRRTVRAGQSSGQGQFAPAGGIRAQHLLSQTLRLSRSRRSG
jgi:hypothetical protein